MRPAEAAAFDAFLAAHTEVLAPPLVPEIRLHLAGRRAALWHKSADELAAMGLEAPFWAFAWAGGQALARFLLDHRALVQGRRVLDFGTGSGLVAIAAALAGAAAVTACDHDPDACRAAAANARLNGAALAVTGRDMLGSDADGAEILLAGDVCYEQPLAARLLTWLRARHDAGCRVLIGDPGRGPLPTRDLERVAAYGVRTERALEDSDLRNAVVWRFPDGQRGSKSGVS